MVAYSLIALLVAATSAAGGAPSGAAVRRGAVMPSPAAALLAAPLRLRGGVREIEDLDDWEAVQAEAGERLLVVDFTAVWCGPCQKIAPVYAELADEYNESALFVKVDVDNLGELAQQLGVTSMPTFLFFRCGEMIDSMRGADEAGLRALVAEHAVPVPVAA